MAAATSIKQKFARQGSAVNRMPPQAEGEGNGSIEHHATERTPMLGRIMSSDSGTPYYKSEHAYIRWPALVLHTTWQVLISNYVNVLLVFVPLGIISGALHWNPTVVFILNFFAIMPLASLLSFATEELAVPLGQTLGGLMNATFGNAVELIVSRCRGHF
jgi:Ca2+:H+ antiporter